MLAGLLLPYVCAYVCANGNGPKCMGANGSPLDERDPAAAAANCTTTTNVPAGQDCLCLAGGIPIARRHNLTYRINATHNYNGPVLDLPTHSASGNTVSRLVKILLHEGMGYNYRAIGATWQSIAFVLGPSGCKDIFQLKKPCTDYDEWNPKIHMGLEGWSGAHSALQNNLVPTERRAIQLPKHTYAGREGLFIMKSAVDKAYFDKKMVLGSYKGWNSTMFPEISTVFDSLGDAIAKLGGLKAAPLGGTAGTDGTLGGKSRAWADAMYAETTGDYGDICYDAATGVLTSDNSSACAGNVWVSPTCRSEPLACIPAWTTGGWAFSEITQWAAFYNMPLAIIDTTWGEYTTAPKKVQSAFYWWFPDTIFSKNEPEMVAFPAHSPDKHGQADFRTALVDTELSKFCWHHLGKADNGRGAHIIHMLERVAIYDSEIANMMVQLGNAMPGDDVACDFARTYETRWRDWIPRSINWCDAGEMMSTDGKCVACEEGYVPLTDGSKCVECTPGYYCPRGSSEPITCTPGFFCPKGSLGQTPCPEGTINSLSGANSSDVCVGCEPGQFNGKEGRSLCDKCPMGFYSGDPGAAICAPCAIGTYQPQDGQPTCVSCPASFVTEVRGSSGPEDCTCDVDEYWDREADLCRRCQDKAVCRGGLKLPVIYEGYYAEYVGNVNSGDLLAQEEAKKKLTYTPKQGAFSQLKVWMCASILRCPGDVNAIVPTMKGGVPAKAIDDLPFPVRTPGVCPPGSYRIACGQCEADTHGSKCTEDCDGGMGTTTVVLVLLFLPCLMTAVYFATASPYAATPTAAFQLVSTLGIVVFFLQSLAVIQSFDIPWPIELNISLDLFLFDLGKTAAGCVFGQNFVAQYWLGVLMPPLFILSMGVAYIISQFVPVSRGQHLRMNVDNCLNVIGTLAAALYITLCKVVIAYFECQPNPGDTDDTLVKYKQVECSSIERTRATVPMILGMEVYVIAFFCLTGWLNYTAPRKFTETWFRIRCKFLVNRWRPDVWWWGQVFMARNLCVSLCTVLSPDPTDQFMILSGIMALFLTANGMMMPWKDVLLCAFDNAITCLVLVTVAAGHSILHFAAIKKQAQFNGNELVAKSAEDASSAYAVILILLVVLVGLWVAVIVAYSVIQGRPKTIRKNMESEREYVKATTAAFEEVMASDLFWPALQRILETSTYYGQIGIEAWLRGVRHHLQGTDPDSSSSRDGRQALKRRSRSTAKLTGRLYTTSGGGALRPSGVRERAV